MTITFIPHASSSKGNLYTVDDGKTRLMLEAGLPWREIRRALEFRTSEIRGVLLTHGHKDHCKGAVGAALAGLDVYASQATLDSLGLRTHRFHAIYDTMQFHIGSWAVMPFRTVHEGESGDTLGFLLANQEGEKLLFLTDSMYCPFSFTGLTVIAIEVNYDQEILDTNVREGGVDRSLRKRIRGSHMSLATALDFFRSNDMSTVREIHLLHLSDSNSDAARFKAEVEAVTGKPTYIC